MGLILDTSTLVTAERRGHSVRDIFAHLRSAYGDVEVGLSAVTVVELADGVERAKHDAQRQSRKAFVDDLLTDITIHPITSEIAHLAEKISGQEAERGITIPFEDLVTGATALHLGSEVVTENARHFEMIPGLVVRKL
jgi:predicted nucleic acid-binding protein